MHYLPVLWLHYPHQSPDNCRYFSISCCVILCTNEILGALVRGYYSTKPAQKMVFQFFTTTPAEDSDRIAGYAKTSAVGTVRKQMDLLNSIIPTNSAAAQELEGKCGEVVVNVNIKLESCLMPWLEYLPNLFRVHIGCHPADNRLVLMLIFFSVWDYEMLSGFPAVTNHVALLHSAVAVNTCWVARWW